MKMIEVVIPNNVMMDEYDLRKYLVDNGLNLKWPVQIRRDPMTLDTTYIQEVIDSDED